MHAKNNLLHCQDDRYLRNLRQKRYQRRVPVDIRFEFLLSERENETHLEFVPKRFAIVKRNEWMMTNADIVIAYVNRNYGGAYKSLQAAKRKKKKIINICDFLS